MKILSLFLVLLVSVYAEKARFDHYRVYRIEIENDDQLKALKELSETSDSVNLKCNNFFTF
jgi:hypothetical protein